MTFLLGRQAMFGHDPPIYFRSTTAVRLPSLAIVQAANLPAVPPPSTRASKFSGAFIRFISFRWVALAVIVYAARKVPSRSIAGRHIRVCNAGEISVRNSNVLRFEPSRLAL